MSYFDDDSKKFWLESEVWLDDLGEHEINDPEVLPELKGKSGYVYDGLLYSTTDPVFIAPIAGGGWEYTTRVFVRLYAFAPLVWRKTASLEEARELAWRDYNEFTTKDHQEDDAK